MKRIFLTLIGILLFASCGPLEVRESSGYDERFSRRPADEGRMVYSEFNLEEGFEPVYKGQYTPEYYYKPDTKDSDMMIEELNK